MIAGLLQTLVMGPVVGIVPSALIIGDLDLKGVID